MADQRKPWVAGRTRESADGLARQPRTEEERRKIREAADRARARGKRKEQR